MDCHRHSLRLLAWGFRQGQVSDPIPISSGPESLSITAALRAAELSKLAYGKNTLPGGCVMIDLLPAADIQCMVATEPGKTTFAFRGTDDIKGWMTDASIAFHDLGNGVKVHSGFWGTVDAVWPLLWPMVSDAVEAGSKIYTTGHSKGAAESRLFTLRLAMKGVMVTESITFGEPRSLNKGAADLYNSFNIPTYRIVNSNDLVCRVPWRLGLYKHVGRSVFIDRWDQITFDETWYAHLGSDVAEAIRQAFKFKNAATYDHLLALYIDALTKYNISVTQ